jgi:hypothetical protein
MTVLADDRQVPGGRQAAAAGATAGAPGAGGRYLMAPTVKPAMKRSTKKL